MSERLVTAALVPLWLTAAGGWASWVAAYRLTGALRTREPAC